MVGAYAGLGGYISEKMLGNGTSSSLYLGNSANGPIVLGTGPTISTQGVTNSVYTSGGSTATLHGNLASLNGMPLANVWFRWGYTPATLTQTSTVSVVTTTGDKAITITGYDAGLTVYYQFRATTDSATPTIGATRSFVIDGGWGLSYWLLRNILSLVIAAGILILVLRVGSTGNWVAALTLTIIGLIAIVMVQNMIHG
jgi:hypothetical protein